MANKPAWLKFLLILIGALICLNFMSGADVSAQVEEVDWTPPINLSSSGSTDAPVSVIDSSGVIHVVWRDTFSGPFYVSFRDGQWSAPVTFEFPFSGSVPTLIADNEGNIHAFWIGIDNFEGFLYYSNVNAEEFGTGPWSQIRQLSDSALTFDVAIDQANALHLSFLRAVDADQFPAGIYYLQREPSIDSWSQPISLYQSPYLRLLTPEDARLSTLLQENGEGGNTIFTMWENRPRKRIQLARSGDNGTTWDQAVDIVSPESDDSEITPVDVNLAIHSDHLLVIWKNVISESRCQLVYQTYTFGGEKLSEVSPLLADLFGCPEGNFLLPIGNEYVVLLTKVFDKTYLLAWDGEQWSLPQAQTGLSDLIDAETFLPVSLGCLQPIWSEPNLFLIGCDLGDGGDVWSTSTQLDIHSSWFASPSVWVESEAVISNTGNIRPITILPDRAGNLHAVWAQSVEGQGSQYALHYARWSGDGWAFIESIIEPPMGKVNELSTAIDSNSRIFVVWSGGESGEIYFSWANAQTAWDSKEWVEPTLLPMPRYVGRSTNIYVDDQDMIHVVYSIPINEARGVYLIQSSDGGISWTEPKLVLDGVVEGWEIVDQTQVIGNSNSHLFVLAKRSFLTEDINQGTVYYLHSEDGGISWSSAEQVNDANLLGSQIALSQKDVIYRVWQETAQSNVITWLDYSLDFGVTWSDPASFTSFNSQTNISDLVVDSLGNLHLVQLSQANNGLFLEEWIWNGSQWLVGESLTLGGTLQGQNSAIAAGLSENGFLGVLLTRLMDTSAEAGLELIFTGRQLDLGGNPAVTPLPPVLTPEIASTTVPMETPLSDPDVTQTPQGNNAEPNAQNGSSLSIPGLDKYIGPIIGFIAAGFIILLSIIVLQSFARRNQ